MADNPLGEATFIVWVDYRSEGWRPRTFETGQEAVDFIMSGESCSPMLLTVPMDIWLGLPERLRADRGLRPDKGVIP